MLRTLSLTLAASAALLSAGTAAADTNGIFKYTDTSPSGGGLGNKMDFFEMTYQEVGGKDLFTLEYSYKPEVTSVPNGFWLVISDGPNPKNNFNEYAILYGDLTNNRVTAHMYNGLNNANSYQVADSFIDSFTEESAIEYDALSKTFNVSLDVTGINAFTPPANGNDDDWDGVMFGKGTNKVGIWFHPMQINNAHYDDTQDGIDEGELTSAHIRGKGWYDYGHLPTEHMEVSEPATLALLGLGLAGIAAGRRRKATA